MKIESTRVVRDNKKMIINDADGVGTKNIGNSYRAGGDPDMIPVAISSDIMSGSKRA